MQVNNLIIDGTNIEFRIFHIARKHMVPDGLTPQSNITNKFLKTFRKLVEQFEPINIYASWDRKLDRNSTNFRHILMDGKYKAGRIRPPDIQDMYDQEIKLIEILEAFGVKNIFPNKLEADDVCAWLTTVVKGMSVIVSVDQDLLQLVSPTVSVWNMKELITFDNFSEIKGMRQSVYKLFKSIKGDPSDNIEGLKGYGDVYSRKLASNWKENKNKLTQEQISIVEKNIQLIDLNFGYKFQKDEQKIYENQFNYLKNIECDFGKFIRLCKEWGLTDIVNEKNEWLQNTKRNCMVDLISKLI
jgi:5'-3' exonuclease